jgi:hypothetical protein
VDVRRRAVHPAVRRGAAGGGSGVAVLTHDKARDLCKLNGRSGPLSVHFAFRQPYDEGRAGQEQPAPPPERLSMLCSVTRRQNKPRSGCIVPMKENVE